METYYERSLHSKYRSQGVQTSFYESTPSPTNSLGDQISSGSTRSFGHAGTNLPYAPKERHSRGASRFSRFLFKRIPGTEIFRRVAAGYRSKESKRPHSCTSFPYVHDKLCAKLCRKRRLRIQIDLQDAYFHVPIHPNSRKYFRFAFENRVYQFQVLPFGLNTAPQVFTRLGHTVTVYLHRQGISVIPYLDDWLIHHPDRQVLLRHQTLLINTLDLVGFILNRKKSELDLTQDLQFLGIRLRLDIGKALLPESKAWEIVARAHYLSSLRVLNYTQVSQLRTHPIGSFVPETSSTSFSFIRSDRPVYDTVSFRPLGPCQPTSAMARPTFSYLRNPDPYFSGGPYDFYGRLHSRVGRPHGGFQDFGYLDPLGPQAPYQLSGVQGCHACPTALGPSASGPPGYDHHGQFDSGFIYQQAGRDSLPHLAASNCRSFPLVGDSEHNSPFKKHSRLSEHDSRPPISSESEWSLHPEIVERIFRVWGTPEVELDSAELPTSSVHVSNSGAKSPSGGCSVSGLAGEVNVRVSPIPPAQQSHAEASVDSGGGGNSRSPLVAVSVLVPTSTMSLCGTPSSSPLPSGSSVPAGPEVHLRWKVVPSARMEALM